MQLSFHQSQADYTDFLKHTMTSNRWVKIAGIAFLCMVLFNLIAVVVSKDFQVADLLSWLLPVVMIVIIWIFILKRLQKKQSSNNDLLTGKRKIQLLEDRIHVWTPISETNYPWFAIQKLEQSTKNYFLYIGHNQAILVSKTAFKNDMEQQAFERLVNKKLSS